MVKMVRPSMATGATKRIPNLHQHLHHRQPLVNSKNAYVALQEENQSGYLYVAPQEELPIWLSYRTPMRVAGTTLEDLALTPFETTEDRFVKVKNPCVRCLSREENGQSDRIALASPP